MPVCVCVSLSLWCGCLSPLTTDPPSLARLDFSLCGPPSWPSWPSPFFSSPPFVCSSPLLYLPFLSIPSHPISSHLIPSHRRSKHRHFHYSFFCFTALELGCSLLIDNWSLTTLTSTRKKKERRHIISISITPWPDCVCATLPLFATKSVVPIQPFITTLETISKYNQHHPQNYILHLDHFATVTSKVN